MRFRQITRGDEWRQVTLCYDYVAHDYCAELGQCSSGGGKLCYVMLRFCSLLLLCRGQCCSNWGRLCYVMLRFCSLLLLCRGQCCSGGGRLCYVMLRYVTLCYVVLRYVTLCNVVFLSLTYNKYLFTSEYFFLCNYYIQSYYLWQEIHIPSSTSFGVGKYRIKRSVKNFLR